MPEVVAGDTMAPPPLIHAGGHKLLRLSEGRKRAVVKPTTVQEVAFYDLIASDDTFGPLRRFLPRAYSVHAMVQRDPAHPTHTHEIELENLCLLDRMPERSSDEEGTTTDAETTPGSLMETPAMAGVAAATGVVLLHHVPSHHPSVAHGAAPPMHAPLPPPMSKPASHEPASLPEGAKSAGGEEMVPSGHSPESSKDNTVEPGTGGGDADVAGPDSPSGAKRTQWSAPSVLDLKIGRIRHTPMTPPARVEHMVKKDSTTPTSTLGLRICGLRHERRLVDSTEQSADAATVPGSDPVSSFAEPRVDDDESDDVSEDDAEEVIRHTTLRHYDTMQQRRAEPALRPRQRRFVLGRRMEWVEGKALGRRADRDLMVKSLRRFCTCVELLQRGAGEQPVPTVSGSFTPQPHLPLLVFYRDEVATFLDALDASRLLDRYSFVSSSLLLVHDFHVRASPCDVSPPSAVASVAVADGEKDLIKFRAQVRLVDFSNSGCVSAGTAYPDSTVGFRESIVNLVALFDDAIQLTSS